MTTSFWSIISSTKLPPCRGENLGNDIHTVFHTFYDFAIIVYFLHSSGRNFRGQAWCSFFPSILQVQKDGSCRQIRRFSPFFQIRFFDECDSHLPIHISLLHTIFSICSRFYHLLCHTYYHHLETAQSTAPDTHPKLRNNQPGPGSKKRGATARIRQWGRYTDFAIPPCSFSQSLYKSSLLREGAVFEMRQPGRVFTLPLLTSHRVCAILCFPFLCDLRFLYHPTRLFLTAGKVGTYGGDCSGAFLLYQPPQWQARRSLRLWILFVNILSFPLFS